ncbi:hypothetical protein J4233_03425 [Candidatus Pacearchaeota archaeon]|nr:hypothetical protein [Candidatus Pacearchaeota archaeon]
MVRKVKKEDLPEAGFGQAIYQNFDIEEEHSKTIRFLEFMIYFVGFLGALLALPQAYRIWFSGDVIGSLNSWIALAAFTPFWILYGILNRKFSLAMTYVVWLVAALLIIVGIYVNG